MPAEAHLGGETTQDAVLGGRLRLRQPRRGHRFGHDGVLLAAATPAGSGDHVVDLGSGVGVAGLALACRCPGTRVTLVEREEALVALAAENVAANGFSNRARAVALDVGASAREFARHGLVPGSADVVMMNPPFNAGARFAPSPDPGRRSAHLAAEGQLPMWLSCAERLLRPGGALAAVWRGDGLTEMLAPLAERFGAITLMPVYPRPSADAIRVLVAAVKGSGAPLRLRPGLLLNDMDGRPTPDAESVLRGGQALP